MSAIFTARPAPARWQRPVAILFILGTVLGGLLESTAPASAATGSITGVAFQDLNRNGVHDTGESPQDGHQLYLFDAEERFLGGTVTDVEGRYSFTGLAAGEYLVAYDVGTWRELRDGWVPTTTGGLQPQQSVAVDGDQATAHFGWRPIVTSDDLSEPMSAYTGPEGLTVQSYNDVMNAQDLHGHVTDLFLVGDEAPHTTIRFAYSTSDSARTTIWREGDTITRVRVIVYTSYARWLDVGDRTLAHEYGHAWMNYHNYYVQQDTDGRWEALLLARGIDPDDERLGSSYAWMPGEIAAEDYRQLLASDNARSGSQLNNDIPRPWEVEGLDAFLRTTFTQDPNGGEDGTGDDDPGDTGTEPAPEPSSADVQVVDLTAVSGKAKGRVFVDLGWTGTTGAEVDVYRNKVVVARVADLGAYRDETGLSGSPELVYRVCDTGTAACSDAVIASGGDDGGGGGGNGKGPNRK